MDKESKPQTSSNSKGFVGVSLNITLTDEFMRRRGGTQATKGRTPRTARNSEKKRKI